MSVRFLLLALGLSFAWVHACSPAHGTTFIPMSEGELAARSTAAVIGWVTAIETAEKEATRAINTYVHIEADEIILGALPQGKIVLRELGGSLRGRSERVFGSPEYAVGEEVLVFLARSSDGALHTTGMAMGKYTVQVSPTGVTTLLRKLGKGVSVLQPSSRHLITNPEPETYAFDAFVERVKALADRRPDGARELHGGQAIRLVPPELESAAEGAQRDAFTYLSSPSRWFEPDVGEAVEFRIDANGDAEIGPDDSRAAVNQALAAWSDLPSSGLLLADGGSTDPITFSGCSGGNRIIFNDPFDEITDPVNCGGVLAVGGFCASAEAKDINGTTFRRIRVGKMMFNNGWYNCLGWTQCNLAEVATHELGHAIGFGHSTDYRATMYQRAHFDGRCASLAQDDIDAATFVYPLVVTPMPTATSTPPSIPTRSATRTATATPSRTPKFTRTPTMTRTSTRTRTPTAIRTATATAVPTSTAVPSDTPAPTATRTLTTTRTATATRTNTARQPPTGTYTATPTRTGTPSPTQTSPQLHDVNGHIRYYSAGNGVPGATVRLRGPTEKNTLTTETGAYGFTEVAESTWELEAEKVSDFAAGVSALDATFVLQHIVGLRSLDPIQRLACDVTGDGRLSSLDAAYILQFTVGLIERVPVADTCGTDWAFVPVPETTGHHSVLNPSTTEHTCQDGKITIETLTEAAENQDFQAILFGDCTGNWQADIAGPSHAAGGRRPPQVRLGRLWIRGHKARLPIRVRAWGPFHALDAELAYDPGVLQPVGVRPRRSRGTALLRFETGVPGLLRVAMASAEPLGRYSRIALIVDFELSQTPLSPGSVQALRATVDERPAELLPPRTHSDRSPQIEQ